MLKNLKFTLISVKFPFEYIELVKYTRIIKTLKNIFVYAF